MSKRDERVKRLEQQASKPARKDRPAYIVLHGQSTWNGWTAFEAERDVIDVVVTEDMPEDDPNLEFLCEDEGTRIYRARYPH